MKDKVKDLILGLVFLIVAGVALVGIRTSEGGTQIDSAAKLNYATMPTVYACLLILLVAIFMFQTLLSMRSEKYAEQKLQNKGAEREQHEETAVSPKTIIFRTWGTLLILLFYVFSLEYINFLFLTILFLVTLFLLYGQRSIRKITAVSICGGSLYYFIFIYILNLPV